MKTTNYSKKTALDTWSKQTQTKPILLGLMTSKIALSEACGERSRTYFKRLGL